MLLLGLLGVAAMIPIGKVAMSETNNADRTGDCGRAGLRDVRVRRMLDPNNWVTMPASNVFIIDPLGCTNMAGGTAIGYFGGTVSGGTVTNTVQRINLKIVERRRISADQAEEIFRSARRSDFWRTKNTTDRPAPPATGAYDGSFSWFATVAPQAVEDPSGNVFPTAQACVSIVVCWKRLFTNNVTNTTSDAKDLGETIVSNVKCDSDDGFGGIGIEYDKYNNAQTKRVALLYTVDSAAGTIRQATWYRVVSAGNDGSKTRATLVGSDWHGGGSDGSAKLIIVKGATGVYTTTVKLDNDMIWTK